MAMRWRAGARWWMVAASLVLCVGVAAQEQKVFSAEGKLEHPVELPMAVLKLLSQEPDVKDTMRADVAGRLVQRTWYDAMQVQLTKTGTPAILVRGNCPLCGAHAGWFWIYAQRAGRWRRLLFAVGDELELMDERHAGYRDVRSVYATAAAREKTVYRFDGKRYVVVSPGK